MYLAIYLTVNIKVGTSKNFLGSKIQISPSRKLWSIEEIIHSMSIVHSAFSSLYIQLASLTWYLEGLEGSTCASKFNNELLHLLLHFWKGIISAQSKLWNYNTDMNVRYKDFTQVYT